METDDVRLGERLARLDARLTVLEGWRASLKNDLDNAAKHTLEVDKQCQEIQLYLEERRKEQDQKDTLIYDIKKWLAILIIGWVLVAFFDGAKVKFKEWLIQSPSGHYGQ